MLAVLRKKSAATATMWAASLSLTVFWIANILKEAYPPVKATFNFYAPVGPLLGLFCLSLIIFLAAVWALAKAEAFTVRISDKASFLVYVLATSLFFLMVFPPFFEPIVDMLAGK